MKGHILKRKYFDRKTGKMRQCSTWSVRYDEPVPLGQRRKQKIKSGFRTRKAAEAWFNKKADELNRGIVGIQGAVIRELTNSGLSQRETRRALEFVAEHYNELVAAWKKYHG